ncbi:choice-of-anchor Q domain-containing protein [Candidatus Electronema sp. JC]|uniref:choice-of-anchor Q domain-containing protein n=1 Tax=Candidatus Electronema sp. JC TaxID=3401570 RepID=UPI003AA9B9AE
MKTKILSGLLTAALGLTAQAAHSANITVDAGGNCTLAEAITSANNDSATGNGCVDGSGADTITLQTNVTLAAALPDISSAITIEGGGKTINGNGGNFSVLKIVSGGTLTLNNATITGGHPLADSGGGIYADTGSTVILNSCTVSGNTAGGSMGGGIFAAGTTSVTLNNSTVSGNACNMSGGGIGAVFAGALVTLNSSTVSANTANGIGIGGGIFVTENGASVTLRSSIVSNNNAVAGNEVYTANSGVVTADSYNVFGHSGESDVQAYGTNGVSFTPGATDVNATSNGSAPAALSAILSPLADNGGPTQTHALPSGSPAVNLDATCGTGLIEDQRGIARPATGCDAGAYEYVAPTGVNDIDDDFILDLADNCMTVYNPDQQDTDGDRIGDACDNCPQAANFNQQDSNADGKGDVCCQSSSVPSSTRLAPVYKLLL